MNLLFFLTAASAFAQIVDTPDDNVADFSVNYTEAHSAPIRCLIC